ncbi:MAG: ABC transporter permease [Thermoleophilaceae bacterium]|nr:ABC transporter permease [Thermoleophilaceae bacterium]
MRLGFFLKEAFRALRRNAAPSFAATMTILVTALLLGVFIPIVQATTGGASQVRDRVLLDVYVKDAATEPQIQRLGTALKNLDNVGEVEFISKATALKAEMKERGSEAYEVLGNNPLPDAFRVTPDDPDRIDALADAIVVPDSGEKRGSITSSPAFAIIDEIQNKEEETQKILSATGGIFVGAIVLAVLLTIASVALVANTIRLSVFARRREIEVMKLVGATNWFIRWPFVIEGVVVGVMGGILAILLLALAKVTVIDSLQQTFDFLSTPETLGFLPLSLVLLFACVAVSAIGSGLTLGRFLRV